VERGERGDRRAGRGRLPLQSIPGQVGLPVVRAVRPQIAHQTFQPQHEFQICRDQFEQLSPGHGVLIREEDQLCPDAVHRGTSTSAPVRVHHQPGA
jgi:hypothetical protein